MSTDIIMEVTKCPRSCTECTGLYTSDVLKSKIICNCVCHEKKNNVADGLETPESATSNPYSKEISRELD